MTRPGRRFDPIRVRVAPVILIVVAFDLVLVFGSAMFTQPPMTAAPWWATLFFQLFAIATAAVGAAALIDPRPILLRQALGATAVVWLVVLVAGVVLAANGGHGFLDLWPVWAIIVALVLAVWVLIGASTELSEAEAEEPGLGELGMVVVLASAIVVAGGAAVVIANVVASAARAIGPAGLPVRLPWAAVAVVVLLPVATFAVAAIDSRRAAGGTFYAQAAANRRNSVLLLLTLVGVVAATAEIIAVTLTFDPVPALWTAGAAALVGLAAAAGANRFGASIILDSAGAKRADETGDHDLIDVVRELSLAAGIPPPMTYVIQDGSQNAFATGRDPDHASLVVTRGLLDRMDREELQGVIGHELGHVRNLDTRYALYVAVLVGLVAVVTDGFLRIIVDAWRHGAFYWRGSGKSAAGAFATGILVGIFLLFVAALLRVLAPLFSALVQAASSRQREFLADATSVEFTRNPRALERALTSIASDTDTLEAANRGTQHLWFRNPVKDGSDRRAGLLSTHPSLTARIDRLRTLEGLAPLAADEAAATSAET